MRVITGNIGPDGMLLCDLDLIIVRDGLSPVDAYGVIRCLLPDADPTLVLALSEQAHGPSDDVPEALLALAEAV